MIPPHHADPYLYSIDAHTDPPEREYQVWVQYPVKVFARDEQDAEEEVERWLQLDGINTTEFDFTAVEKEQQ